MARLTPMSVPAWWLAGLCLVCPAAAGRTASTADALRVGARLPDVTMIARDGSPVRLRDTQGTVRLLSVVPQLNTPACDEQTHRFSERNGGLDRVVTFMTLSTNTFGDQSRFADQAGIRNMAFLSDSPRFEFGRATGLLRPSLMVLQRAVLVVDADDVIRYVEIVPMGQLPSFEAALAAAGRLAGGG